MNDFSQALSIASSGLKAQSGRLRHVSENIANADTPGYHRKVVSFDLSADTGEVSLGRMTLDPAELREIYDPSHPLANETGHYDGSNVELIIEIADAREAQRSYEANLKMLDQARQMSSSLMDLLRR
ncbi:MAG: flagellar basal body rod protein FlgC [Planktotalea sp.]|uniref:flagellar basal body rod protein FlgC n=1 Tax=Planktotalea sp. TaxID=2029877 RepID=UPI003C74AABB